MKVEKFHIEGPLLITGTRFLDERGFFSETYNRQKLSELGLPDFVQDNLSQSHRGVFRGLHWQTPPHSQGKLVTCLSGSIRDFVIDIRRSSPTFGQELEVCLSGSQLQSFWVPEGFAHGFFSLESGTLVHYKVTNFWHSSSERSLRITPALVSKIATNELILSAKDSTSPTLEEIISDDPQSLF